MVVKSVAGKQPGPVPGDRAVALGLIDDIKLRVEFGKAKYGTELKTFNGRDALVDAYQEAIDMALYIRQEIMERDSAATVIVKHSNPSPGADDDADERIADRAHQSGWDAHAQIIHLAGFISECGLARHFDAYLKDVQKEEESFVEG